jgi:hypothetical protein
MIARPGKVASHEADATYARHRRACCPTFGPQDAEPGGLGVEILAVVELGALAQLELDGQVVQALPLGR